MDDSSQSKPSGFLTFVGSMFLFLVFAVIVVLWVQRSGPAENVEQKRADARIAKRVELQKADEEKLTKAAWIDQAKGIVRVPISDAKRVVLAELKSKKPVISGVKVEPSLPMAAPYDPNAKEPAPPAMPSSPQGADTLHFDTGAAKPAPSAALKRETNVLVASSLSASTGVIHSNETSETIQ